MVKDSLGCCRDQSLAKVRAEAGAQHRQTEGFDKVIILSAPRPTITSISLLRAVRMTSSMSVLWRRSVRASAGRGS
jgi:hypothetical protein